MASSDPGPGASQKHHHIFDKNAHPFIPHICTIYIHRLRQDEPSVSHVANTTDSIGSHATVGETLIGNASTIPEFGVVPLVTAPYSVNQTTMAPTPSDIQLGPSPIVDKDDTILALTNNVLNLVLSVKIQESLIRAKIIDSLIDVDQPFEPSSYYEFIPGSFEPESETTLVDAKVNILNPNINLERLLTLLDESYATEMTSSAEGGKIYVFSEEHQKYMLVDPLRVFFGNIPYSTTWKRLKKFITNTVKEIDPAFQLHIEKVEIPLIDASSNPTLPKSASGLFGSYVSRPQQTNTSTSATSSLTTSSAPSSLTASSSSNALSLANGATTTSTPLTQSTIPTSQQFIQIQPTPHGEHVKSRGFGIVTTDSQQTSKKLIDIFNNMEFDKRVLTVRFDRFPEFSNHHNSTNFRQHQNFQQLYQQPRPEHSHMGHHHHQQLPPISVGHRNSIGSKGVFANSADYFDLGYERNKYLQFKFYSPSSFLTMYWPGFPLPPPPPQLQQFNYPQYNEEIPSGSSSPPSPTRQLLANISSLTLVPSSSSSALTGGMTNAMPDMANIPVDVEIPENNGASYVAQHPGAVYGHHMGAHPYAYYYGGIPPQPTTTVDPTLGVNHVPPNPLQYYGYIGPQGNMMPPISAGGGSTSSRRGSNQLHLLVAAAATAAQQKQSQLQSHEAVGDYGRTGGRSRGGSGSSSGSNIANTGGDTGRGYLNVHNSQIVHRANSKYFERRKSRHNSSSTRNSGTEE